MPGRGRPRKPTALKILEGNPTHESKDRLDLSLEPEYGEAQKGAFHPPSCLSPAAKLEWKRVIKPLAKTRLYQVVAAGPWPATARTGQRSNPARHSSTRTG